MPCAAGGEGRWGWGERAAQCPAVGGHAACPQASPQPHSAASCLLPLKAVDGKERGALLAEGRQLARQPPPPAASRLAQLVCRGDGDRWVEHARAHTAGVQPAEGLRKHACGEGGEAGKAVGLTGRPLCPAACRRSPHPPPNRHPPPPAAQLALTLGEARVDEDGVCRARGGLLHPVERCSVGRVQRRAAGGQQQVGEMAVEEDGGGGERPE